MTHCSVERLWHSPFKGRQYSLRIVCGYCSEIFTAIFLQFFLSHEIGYSLYRRDQNEIFHFFF